MGVYQDLKQFQKTAAEDDYVTYYFYRTLSRPLSAIIISLGLNTFFASALTIILDLLAMYLIYEGFFYAAGVLVILAFVFDCCDGEIARYHKSLGKMKKERMYGAYLDETLGVVGFYGITLFLGYAINQQLTAIIAGFGLLMVNYTCYVAKDILPGKRELAEKFEKKFFKNLKGRIGFSGGVQRIILALAVFFQSWELLLVFAVLINGFWIAKFWLYRNQ
ncbi:hypothetical protein A3K73_01730 [Candidatus Pacearchaeota archaeon RBG_13_36_9]|nr:MAG: hypothetical protein A3K73_01730 [Candidatus Pacearchaeota archaeon RBG_13_36_9]